MVNSGTLQQNILKFGIIAFLFSFLLFQVFHFKKFNPLNGVQIEKSQLLKDSLKNKLSWFNGTKQKYYELKLNEDLLLKSPLIKLRNQVQFSLFQKINAQDIYKHNDNLFRFYSKNYNEEFLFKGEKEIDEKINKLSAIQSYLGAEIPIITLIAPSKIYYAKQDLPSQNKTKSKQTNYYWISKKLKENKLKLIDFNHFFENYESQVPIIGKGGIHWSSYASCIAMDSLVKYLSKNKNIEFQRPKWEIEKSFKIDYNDQDLAELLNVLFPPYDKSLRNVKFLPILQPKKKIKALIISDSFFDVISRTNLKSQIFTKDSKYYYYFKSERLSNELSIPIDKRNLLNQMKNVDCIIILNDIINMESFGWGFIENAYQQINN